METRGYFGINRNDRMTNFFSRLSWPAWGAVAFLYSVALLELLLGIVFAVLFTRKFWLMTDKAGTLFGSGVLAHLAFKGGGLQFAMFIFGDILFGDRTELWQHVTYFSFVMFSYYLFMQHQKDTSGQHADTSPS